MTNSIQANTEPVRDQFPNQLALYFAATRPAFILATIIPFLVGTAYSSYQGYPVQWFYVGLGLLAAILLHAGVNVLNDYYDALNGTDAINDERIYPFTGGSRFIQNQLLSTEQTLYFGLGLLIAVCILGLYLVVSVGWPLFLLGLFGVILGWAYSAPPLSLNSKGLGELTVFIGFGLLPVGAYLLQAKHISINVMLISVPLGLLTTNLLYINQYPDRKADIHAQKMHWVARLPPHISRWGYWLISVLAWMLIVIYVGSGLLPTISLISLLPVVASFYAGKELFLNSEQPQNLTIAIKMTLLAMLLHGGLLAISLLV